MELSEISIMFYASLLFCFLLLYLFNRMLMKQIQFDFLSAPYLIFSYVYFIVVPFFNVYFDKYINRVIFIEPPEQSLTTLNFANGIGLAFGILGILCANRLHTKFRRAYFNYQNLAILISIVLPLTVSYGVYSIFISGNTLTQLDDKLMLQGNIVNFILSESSPLFLCWLISTSYVVKKLRPSQFTAIGILLVHLGLVLALSSSRGSRVAMLVQLILAAQIYSQSIIRFRLPHVLAASIAIFLILPAYSNYKYGGTEALLDYLSGKGTSAVAQHYNDPIQFIVGDIGRADIQAPILAGMLYERIEPNYIGESYLSGVLLALPGPIRPDWFRSKIVLGDEAQYGLSRAITGSVQSQSGEFTSSRIYGLAGEALLNFGAFAIPFAFFVFGLISRKCFLRNSKIYEWRQALTSPFFSLLPIYILFYDLDNIVFQTIVVWGAPVIMLKWISMTSRSISR